jgi:hypothetical protein
LALWEGCACFEPTTHTDTARIDPSWVITVLT